MGHFHDFENSAQIIRKQIHRRTSLFKMALTYATHSRMIRPEGSLTSNELIMAEGDAAEPKTMDELTALANELMAGMESTFESASAGITDRLDEVGAKLDEIETNVGDLMTQLGDDADGGDRMRRTRPRRRRRLYRLDSSQR